MNNGHVTERIRVLICGTGSGAHMLAANASKNPQFDVRVLTRSAEKAERWTEMMQTRPLSVYARDGNDYRLNWSTNSFSVTDQPDQVRGCDLILIVVPAFAHSAYLKLLEPIIEEGSIVVGLPGQNGFEFEVRKKLGEKLKNCVVMNFESLPWSCRTIEFGESVRLNGIKQRLVGAIEGDLSKATLEDPLAAVQSLLGDPPTLRLAGHLLGITLMSLNAYSHPPIMYGRWKHWDGTPLDEPPLFFQGVDPETADLLGKISDEVVRTSKRITAECPEVNLSQVIPMYQWDIAHYGSFIKDKTNLMTALRTNALYQGRTHPMIQTEDGRYVPDFGHRFLVEDIQCLVVIRGIAELAGVETPNMDLVLSWGQEKMGKEYLVGSRLTGRDLQTTRCPQRYGFSEIEDLLG
ncbi:MAG TPA: NAD/NADP octopine/nopaline dehydrogenase family protein [Blastocatellia bacterium]|nr:NAD/NADP octopine/nopaline dehydrogenase family protein [Blastocatellia bacterium]